jgi:parallel beta-helix repeat protein
MKKLAVWTSIMMIIIMGFLVLISPRASAGVPVGGYIDQDTLWASELSPYWVESDVIVRNGATLFIDSGVEVLFNGYYSIYIEVGAMIRVLKYSEPRPALFSSNFSIKSIGDWRAIQLNDSSYDQSIIQNSIIEYATYGIRLESASPTIYNNTIRNCTYGIYSNYGCPTIDNNTIENCIEDGINILGNDPGGVYTNTNIENNTVYNNINRGIVFYDVSSVRLRNNSISGSNYNFGVWADTLLEFDHDIDDSNTVEQKPIYYWRNHEHDDETIPSDAGYVGIVNSMNVTAEDLTLTHNGQGVLVAYSNYTRIDNVTTTDHELGIILYSSPYNTIENSNISNNDYNGYYVRASGIHLTSSSNDNNIRDTNVMNNQNDGISVWLSSNKNNITNCNVTNNQHVGIMLYDSSNHIITGNNVLSNNNYGIYLYDSSDNTISNNNVSLNTAWGIYLTYASNNNISNSNISSNDGGGIWLRHSTEDNIIYNNTIGWNGRTATTGVGIRCTDNNNPIITYNDILSNDDYGVLSGGGSDPTIHNNTISGNPVYGVKNEDSGVYIHAEYNWWGDTDNSGPLKNDGGLPLPLMNGGSGDEVSNYVYFDPWLSGSP